MYDSLLYNLARADRRAAVLAELGLRPGQYGLATIHRAESTERPETVAGILSGIGRLELPIVVPLHPRTRAVLNAAGVGAVSGPVRLLAPVSYHEMLILERHARLILTDSGGVQKEAFLLGVPCVTLRNETEWVETVEAGWNRVAGTTTDAVEAAARVALEEVRPKRGQPYGDGHAAEAILGIVADYCRKERS